jgi:2-keto-3-deoxy-L-rhamnonate aldolase RhmA
MRFKSIVAVLVLLVVASSLILAQSKTSKSSHINPMVVLHEKGLPVFGVTHPAYVAGGGRGGGGRGGAQGVPGAPGAAPAAPAVPAAPVTPPPQPSLADVAKETVSYQLSDFEYDSYSPANKDRFMGYMAAILAAGGSMRNHAFIAKIPIVHTNPEAALARVYEQLNMGQVGVMMQEVETTQEVHQVVNAMRFKSKGGTRPEEGFGLAAAYWGLTPEEYKKKADPWPLNKDGELILWTIIESKAGVANVREIAAVPGLTVICVGAGTMGGVFSSVGADGQRVRDQAGFDAAVNTVIDACKEFKKPCSYPANNPADIERLMKMGFNTFTMQSRNQAAFDAVDKGRLLSGRK